MSNKTTLGNYETTLCIAPDTPELDVQKLVTRTQNQIAQQDGQIFSTDHWGKQRLAYPIGKIEFGYYVNMIFTYPTEKITEFENDIKLVPEIIRHLIISLDKDGISPTEVKRINPFQEVPTTPTQTRPTTTRTPRTTIKPATPAAPKKDEATRMKELDEKLGTLLSEDEQV